MKERFMRDPGFILIRNNRELRLLSKKLPVGSTIFIILNRIDFTNLSKQSTDLTVLSLNRFNSSIRP